MESTALVSQAIMEACIKLDIDPVTYLVKNAMKKGDRYHNANAEPHPWQYNKTADWSDLVVKTADAFHWSDRFKGWGVPTWVSADGKKVRGVGVALQAIQIPAESIQCQCYPYRTGRSLSVNLYV